MTVAERDDGDATAEVEVLPAIGIPDMRPVTPSDREIRPGVCRQQSLEAL
jgi:hypothetical protein